MRTVTFLFALLCIAVLVLADTTLLRPPSTAAPVTVVSQQQDQGSFGDSVRMWRRAEVQVVPLDLAIANRAELESLRRRAVQIGAEAVALNNPRAVRDQFDRQAQLVRALDPALPNARIPTRAKCNRHRSPASSQPHRGPHHVRVVSYERIGHQRCVLENQIGEASRGTRNDIVDSPHLTWAFRSPIR